MASAVNDSCDKKLQGKRFSASPKPERIRRTGKTLTFWEEDRNTFDYKALMEKAKPGDVLDFGGGDRHTLARLLGEGDATWIIKTAEGYVLRIPKFNRSLGGVLEGYIEDFVKYQRTLKEDGLNVVNIDLKLSRVPRYLVVEELDIEFTMEQFFGFDLWGKPIQKPRLSEARRREIYNELLRMAPQTWPFERMANLSGSQMGWVADHWVIFDMEAPMDYIGKLNSKKTTFDAVESDTGFGSIMHHIIPASFVDEVDDLVLEERKRQKEKYQWIERSADSLDMDGQWLLNKIYRQDQMIGRVFSMTEDDYDWKEYTNGKLPEKSRTAFKIVKESKRNADTIIYEVKFFKGSKSGLLELQIHADVEDDMFGAKWKLADKKSYTDVIMNGRDFRLYKD